MPAAGQPRKRQFQPTIDSFFARADRDEWLSHAWQHESILQRVRNEPNLPSEVQASLLSVGMRIRKAVPEGYKTHKTSLFSDPTPALPTTTSYAYQPTGPLRVAELTPFCGLHSIGGLGIQGLGAAPVDVFARVGGDIFEDPYEMLASSQQSNISTILSDSAPPANPSKRRFAEDEENDDPGFVLQFCDPAFDLPVSPLTKAFPLFTAESSSAMSRRFAMPKTRRKGALSVDLTAGMASIPDLDLDFGDASFLQPWECDRMDLA